MPRSKILTRAALAAALLVSTPIVATQRYHLELEATPAAVFPYLSKFGSTELHVYAGGVRAETLWLNAFSRNNAPNVTVANPLGRMYVEVPVREIASIVARLAGAAGAAERAATPITMTTTSGHADGLAATRHRFVYGPAAWIDVWTTAAIPPNPQLRTIADELVTGISPATAAQARKLPGTPIHIELNFRRFKNITLLKVNKLTMSADDEEDALTLGSFYARAGVLEKVLGVK